MQNIEENKYVSLTYIITQHTYLNINIYNTDTELFQRIAIST